MSLLKKLMAVFTGGEVSPALYSRVDIDRYNSSLRTARNFIIHPTGGASNRPGTKFVGAAHNGSDRIILQEFVFSRTQAYQLEFGNFYIGFYTDGTVIASGGTPYTITSPYSIDDVEDLRFESSADVIWITHPSYKTRTLTRYGNASWTLSAYDPEDGPFMAENIVESSSLTASAVTGTNITLTLSASISYDTTIDALLHFDGTNGSTTITDDVGHVVTVYGNAQISTAQSVFGGSSLLLDGTGDYITMPNSADWLFLGNFTIAARIRLSSITHTFEIANTGTGAGVYWRFFWDNAATALKFTYENGGTQILASQTWSPSVNTWYEVRVCRSGNNFHLFAGTSGGSIALLGTTVNADAMVTSGLPLSIGAFGALYTEGYIDELIIYNGTATHTAGYTSASTAYSYVTTTSLFTFSPLHVGALFKLRHYIEGQTASTAFGSATTGSSIKCFTTWRLITHGTWTGTLKIQKSTDGGTTWTVLRTFTSVNDFNANTSGTEDLELNQTPFLIRANMTSYTSGTANVDLTSDPFYQDGICRITSWNSNTSVQATVLQEIGATTATISWFEGSWSDYRGYPAVARFYKDRLTFASTPSEPQTYWMTKTGNYYSFNRNIALLDDDSITNPLPSRQLNAINALVAFKKLIAFTSSSNWSIGPIDTTALTPTSVNTDIEEYTGSANIAPVVLGNEVIYNEFGGEIITSAGYQLERDSFVGSELNILARHLFEGYTIKKLAYQRKPNGIVWALRSDGVLLSMTYLREQNVLAWARHDTGGGEVLSISVIPTTSGDDELWMSVERSNGVYIESLRGRRQTDISDHVFLDSYVEYTSPTTVLSSLDHLASTVVGVIADDVDLGTMTVSASGTLGISSGYTSVFVGVPIESDLETLDIDMPIGAGTMQGKTIKVGNVTFKLVNTRGGYIGPNSDTLYEAFTYDALNNAYLREHSTTLGVTSEFSGIVRAPLGAGAQTAGRVFIRQSRPYPITVGQIIPELSPGGSV